MSLIDEMERRAMEPRPVAFKPNRERLRIQEEEYSRAVFGGFLMGVFGGFVLILCWMLFLSQVLS